MFLSLICGSATQNYCESPSRRLSSLYLSLSSARGAPRFCLANNGVVFLSLYLSIFFLLSSSVLLIGYLVLMCIVSHRIFNLFDNK